MVPSSHTPFDPPWSTVSTFHQVPLSCFSGTGPTQPHHGSGLWASGHVGATCLLLPPCLTQCWVPGGSFWSQRGCRNGFRRRNLGGGLEGSGKGRQAEFCPCICTASTAAPQLLESHLPPSQPLGHLRLNQSVATTPGTRQGAPTSHDIRAGCPVASQCV